MYAGTWVNGDGFFALKQQLLLLAAGEQASKLPVVAPAIPIFRPWSGRSSSGSLFFPPRVLLKLENGVCACVHACDTYK